MVADTLNIRYVLTGVAAPRRQPHPRDGRADRRAVRANSCGPAPTSARSRTSSPSRKRSRGRSSTRRAESSFAPGPSARAARRPKAWTPGGWCAARITSGTTRSPSKASRTRWTCCRRAVEIDPHYAAARAFLGLYLIQRVVQFISPSPMADVAEALESAERAIDLAPRDPEVLENAGLVYFNSGRYEDAVAALTRAVDDRAVQPGGVGLPRHARTSWTGDDTKVRGRAGHPRAPPENRARPSVGALLAVFQGRGLHAARPDRRRASTRHASPRRCSRTSSSRASGSRTRSDGRARPRPRWTRSIACTTTNPAITPERYVAAVRLLSRADERAEKHLAGLRAAVGFVEGVMTPSSLEAHPDPSGRRISR